MATELYFLIRPFNERFQLIFNFVKGAWGSKEGITDSIGNVDVDLFKIYQ